MRREDLTAEVRQALLPALEQSIIAAVLIDEADRILFFNQAAERLWGFARAEVLGCDVRMLVPQAIRADHGGYIRKHRESGADRVVGMSREILVERKDGGTLWAVFSLSKIDVAGRIHYLALARDVSHEVARREENRLLLLAINHTDRALLVLDQGYRIVQINRAFTELFGYDASEAVGRLPGALLAGGETGDATLARLRHIAKTPGGFHEEVQARGKTGRTIWVRASVRPIFAEDGQPRNFVGVLSDVTEERNIRDLQRAVLEALASDIALQDVGDFLCRRVEAIAPEVISSILLVDAGQRLRAWAGPRLPPQYSAGLDGVAIGEGVGSCGTAAFRGEAVLVADIETHPLWAPYKQLALPFGLRACSSYPIKRRDGSVAGTFAFYFGEPRGPDAFHERIVDACVHLCMLAIDREESRQQINKLAQFDGLTGLPNRSQLYRHVDSLLAATPVGEIAFLCIGPDRFKDVNDTFGHAAGDQLLVEVANRLRAPLRPDEFLSRIEGDLFVVVAPGCGVERASLLARQLQRAVGETISVTGVPLAMPVSIGISHCPEGGDDRDGLLQNARSAMYRAKEAGGGACLFYSPEMNRIARDRLLLGAALKQAIASDRLHLHYQPQVRLDGGGMTGVEALLRWTDPELGEVSPERFIGLAEEIGEIEAICHWTLREACRQMAQWVANGVPVPVMSVNLSPANLRNRDLPEFMAGLLREFGLPGSCLTIEITESLMLDLTPQTQDILGRIRALGAGLSVDDFGMGYSSLSSLASLPVTEIKIDRSFVADCVDDDPERQRRARALVGAMIGIGHSLGLAIVAEGVEDARQRDLLAQLGCPVAQGFLFARPAPPATLQRWLGTVPPAARASG